MFPSTECTPQDQAEIYDQLAKITPSLERAIKYNQRARDIRLNHNIDRIREKGVWTP